MYAIRSYYAPRGGSREDTERHRQVGQQAPRRTSDNVSYTKVLRVLRGEKGFRGDGLVTQIGLKSINISRIELGEDSTRKQVRSLRHLDACPSGELRGGRLSAYLVQEPLVGPDPGWEALSCNSYNFV